MDSVQLFSKTQHIEKVETLKRHRANTYHSTEGRGDPKKAQSSRAGLFAMT